MHKTWINQKYTLFDPTIASIYRKRVLSLIGVYMSCKMKLEAPRSLYSSPGYNNNISQ